MSCYRITLERSTNVHAQMDKKVVYNFVHYSVVDAITPLHNDILTISFHFHVNSCGQEDSDWQTHTIFLFTLKYVTEEPLSLLTEKY